MQSVNPRTVQKSSKIAIVAGNGDLPILVIEKCIQLGKPYFLIIIKDHGEDTMNKFKCDYTLKLNQIGKALKIIKNNKIDEIIMIGSIERPSLRDMMPDLWTAKFLAKIANKPQGDDNILKNLSKELEYEGFKIIAPESFIINSLSKKGLMGKIKSSKSHDADMAKGFKIAKKFGELDIGQSLVIENGLVLALEGAEGTDEMIKRSFKYKKSNKPSILIKIFKTSQEKRIDRPVIGVETVKLAFKYGFSGIALEANEVLIIDYEKTISIADKKNIFIKGI